MKIKVGSYVGRSTSPGFAINLARIVEALIEYDMYGGLAQRESCRVDANRNWLIGNFLEDKSKPDYLFILDEDMEHHPLTPIILAKRNEPIVSGLYFRRSEKGHYTPIFAKHVGASPETRLGYKVGEVYPDTYAPMLVEVVEFFKGIEEKATVAYHNEPQIWTKEDGSIPMTGGLLDIDASGFGSVVLRRDALEAMSPPYLLDEEGLNGDYVFYRNAQKLGIPIKGDCSTVATHYNLMPIGMQAFCDFVNSRVQETGVATEVPRGYY